MPDWQLYIALVCALIIGFWQGKRYQKKRHVQPDQDINDYYVKGLNYLLNEEPDAAIDTFVQSLDVNSETLETHLALGKMLRKKGEVDRAIRVHQNLLARPGLGPEYLQQAEYELAVDFTKAGLFDRAESLLKNLIQQDGSFKQLSLQRLLDIYRDEKEWARGLEVLQQLAGSRFSKSYEQWASVRAQFCCELAEDCLEKKDEASARQWLKQATSYDKSNVRAAILIGELEIVSGNPKKGIQLLQRILDKSPEFASEILTPLYKGFTALNSPERYLTYLQTANKNQPDTLLSIAIASYIADVQNDTDQAIQYLSEQIQKNASFSMLNKLLEYYIGTANHSDNQHALESLKYAFQQVIAKMPDYQCQHCGYELRSMHWLCPSCKRWGHVRHKPR